MHWVLMTAKLGLEGELEAAEVSPTVGVGKSDAK